MNQKHQNMFHVTLDVNLTAKSIIQSKNGIKINVNVRIKKTKKTLCMQRRLCFESYHVCL